MAKKGNSGTFGNGRIPTGRPKGSENRSTANAREAIARFVDGNSERLQQWLDEIYAEKGAEAAWRCAMDLIEYHVPKLARTELVGDAEKPVATVVKHVYLDTDK